ncbi:N-acetyltransferase family protein [Pseudooceanicola sp. C21-150M6]|uniref:GNAT family N-acetyltransferase n=1 Tax=Pseudooceanicola sp. C21-150M6 TaxID=3434355 RepID=UPI003D7FE325
MVLSALTTRLLTSRDAAEWRKLRAEAVRLYPDAFLTTESEVMAESDTAVATRLDGGGSYGLFHGEKLVGFARMGQSRLARTRHRGYIGGFYVRPDFQGTGAAQALMQGLIAACPDRGIWQLELFVNAVNHRAIRFYQALGFQKEGHLPNAVTGPEGPVDDWFMVMDLRRIDRKR